MTNRSKGWLIAILFTLGLWVLVLGLAFETQTIVLGALDFGGRLIEMMG